MSPCAGGGESVRGRVWVPALAARRREVKNAASRGICDLSISSAVFVSSIGEGSRTAGCERIKLGDPAHDTGFDPIAGRTNAGLLRGGLKVAALGSPASGDLAHGFDRVLKDRKDRARNCERINGRRARG